ncbi:MAG: YidC/Oxa1 family membrane protein insertase [bacterium]|nr:YidC/Oxa1 family membrane protein insertase [bacterium]
MMLIQIPVFIGLYYVIRHFAMGEVRPDNLYSFFYSFGQKYLSLDNVNVHFLGMDLLKGGKDFATMQNQNFYLAIFAAVFTYLQMKLTSIAKPAQTPTVPGAKVPDMSKMMGFMGVFMAFIMGSFVFSMQA